MGWSCTAAAGATMNAWTAHCVKETGSQNVFNANGYTYFWEASRKEHADGRVTGTIFRFVSNDMEGECVKASTFCIAADGAPKRAPAVLAELGKGINHANA